MIKLERPWHVWILLSRGWLFLASGHCKLYVTTVSHLQSRLPLAYKLLRDLGCFIPLKRHQKSTDSSIQNISKELQPQLDVSSVLDECKFLQVDQEVSELDINQRVDHYWNAVFLLKPIDGISRYQCLPWWSNLDLYLPKPMLSLKGVWR